MTDVSPQRLQPDRLQPEPANPPPATEKVFELTGVGVSYSGVPAVRDITFDVHKKQITALIGPSGCGKSTLLRTINRMNDLVPTFRADGQVLFNGESVFEMDEVIVRRYIGMVFQKPNPFPKSIYENVAFGPKVNGVKKGLDAIVEDSLRRAALWEEVSDKLQQSALALSGGQQQRLCIARALAVEPEVLLLDEPCSALDPVATHAIEELIRELARSLTIVIVTHNMQQAARVSDFTAYMYLGEMVEFDDTVKIFTTPSEKATEDYITGRYG